MNSKIITVSFLRQKLNSEFLSVFNLNFVKKLKRIGQNLNLGKRVYVRLSLRSSYVLYKITFYVNHFEEKNNTKQKNTFIVYIIKNCKKFKHFQIKFYLLSLKNLYILLYIKKTNL